MNTSPGVCSISKHRALDIKLLNFYANRDNSAYLEKYNFQQKLVCQFYYHHWIRDIETSPTMVSDLDSESRLALQEKQCKLNC